MELVRRYEPDPGKKTVCIARPWCSPWSGICCWQVEKDLWRTYPGRLPCTPTRPTRFRIVVSTPSPWWLGCGWPCSQPDLSHPQGHSRFEPLVGLIVTLSMGVAGYEAARTALERFLAGGMAVDIGLPTLVLLASSAIKAGMFFYIRRLAHQLDSPTLNTAAKDNLSDVLTSAACFPG